MRSWLSPLAVLAATIPSFGHAQLTGMSEDLERPAADLIFKNGQIYTPEGWASSLAISDGVIVALGDADETAPFRTKTTRIVDLKKKTVMPGLHDMHVHPIGGGMQQFSCQIPHGSAPQAILDIVASCVSDAEPGEWITGRAWAADSFGATPPHKSMLDSVAPDNPVVLTDISGHSSWANSAALEAAGINAETANPDGGIIERDENGEPTGVLRESAAGLVRQVVPPPSIERTKEALAWSLELMLSYGITAFDDAGVSTPGAIAYSSLYDEGKLKQRVRGCLWSRDPNAIEMRNLYARPRFSPTCVKIVLDGVPTDGHTAAMLEPYEPLANGGDSEGREKGLLLIKTAELNPMVADFDRQGLTVKFHAAGDAAVRQGLEAIAYARDENGFSGQYHNVGHNSFVNENDFALAKKANASFEFSPYIWYLSPITRDIRRAVGEDRMKRWIPVKDALDANVLTVPGSDWSVVPSVNPWLGIETLVTRKAPGGKGETLGGGQSITLEQAVSIFTRASAKQMNDAHETGTIEVGKMADIIVVDQNIFDIPVTDIHKSKVLHTLIEGEEVFHAEGVRPIAK